MKIRRITAPDMRQAIRQVREELGADAVILSNKRTDDGVEIVAALDVEASLQQAVNKSAPAARETSMAWPPKQVARPSGLDLWEDEPMDRSILAADTPQDIPVAAATAPRPAATRVEPATRPSLKARHQPSASPAKWVEAMEGRKVGGQDEPAALDDEELPDPYARDRERAASAETAPASSPICQAPDGRSRGPYPAGASVMDGRRDREEGPAPQGLPAWMPEGPSVRDQQIGGRQQASPKGADQGGSASSRVERLEDEMRSLRTLMESQLRVLEWRRYARHHPLQSELMRRLAGLGLAPRLAREVVEDLGDAALGEHGWDLALRSLGSRIPVLGEDLTESGGMFALVGATGVGKTTTVAKLAARFVMRHGRKDIALVSTDNYRIGAYDQLRAYARILDVPLYVAEDAAGLARTLDGLSDRRLVLVDTAGMSQRDTRLMEQMRNLRSASARLQSLLVISASAQRAMTREAVQRFSHLHLAGCVLTKLDEAAQLGDALGAVIDAQLPVAWLGTGQRVPEDLVTARAERLVARAVEMMQQNSDDEMTEERMSWEWTGVAAHG
ncbi:MAG: flagellar biosynthesis protein FlhF [Pseudomonadota bacterium]